MSRRLLSFLVVCLLLLGVGAAVWRVDATQGAAQPAAGVATEPALRDGEARRASRVPPAAGPTGDADADGSATEEPAADDAADSDPPAPSPPPSPVVERLTALVAELEADGVPELGVAVLDADGVPVYEHRADQPLLPASTQKLLVAAAALATMEPEHRFVTTVRSGAAPSGGTVSGDLVLVGAGDPALTTPTFGERIVPERPRTPLEQLADEVRSAGVTRVTGRVVGDPTVFPIEFLPSGWPERYTASLDGTRVSGLTVDAGRRVTEQDGRLLAVAAENPAEEAAAALHRLLEERDVEIGGAPAAAASPTSAAVELAAVESPPVEDLLRYMVQHSDNHLAEALFKTVGLAAVEDGTFAGAGRAVQRVLSPLPLDWSTAVVADGSGLSRDDRLPASLLATLDWSMAVSALGSRWDDLQAVSGESGTLRQRLGGTLAEGRLRGKTGSLRDVRSLSGSVLGPDGGRYHFAVIANGLDAEGQVTVRSFQDELVLALAEDLHGCLEPADAPPAGDGDGTGGAREAEEAPADEREADEAAADQRELACAA